MVEPRAWHAQLVALGVVLALGGCSDSSSSATDHDSDSAVAATTSTTAASRTISTSAPPNTAGTSDGASDVVSDISGIVGIALRGGNFAYPEPVCFDTSFAALSPQAQLAFE